MNNTSFTNRYKEKLKASDYKIDWNDDIWHFPKTNITFYASISKCGEFVKATDRKEKLSPQSIELVKAFCLELLLVKRYGEEYIRKTIHRIIYVLSVKRKAVDKFNPNDSMQFICDKFNHTPARLSTIATSVTKFYSFLFDAKLISEKHISIFLRPTKAKNIDDYNKDPSKLPDQKVLDAFLEINRINREKIDSNNYCKQDFIDRQMLNIMFLQFIRGARISETLGLKKNCLIVDKSGQVFLHHFVAKMGKWDYTPIPSIFAEETQKVIKEILCHTEDARQIAVQFENKDLKFLENIIENYKERYNTKQDKLLKIYTEFIVKHDYHINEIFTIPDSWHDYMYLNASRLTNVFRYSSDYHSFTYFSKKGVKLHKIPGLGNCYLTSDIIEFFKKLREFYSEFISVGTVQNEFFFENKLSFQHFKSSLENKGFFNHIPHATYFPNLRLNSYFFISKAKLKEFIVDKELVTDGDGFLEKDIKKLFGIGLDSKIFRGVRVKCKYQKTNQKKGTIFKVPFEKLEVALIDFYNIKSSQNRVWVGNEYEKIKLSENLFVYFLYQFNPNSAEKGTPIPTNVSSSAPSHVFSNGDTLNIFSRYGYKHDDGSFYSLNTHQPRHWMATNLYKSGATTAFIDKFQGRIVGQSRNYDNRTGKERGEKLKEMLIDKDILKGDLGESVQQWKMQDIPKSTQREWINDIIQQVHFTPYGFCTRNLRINPCEYNVACLKGDTGNGCSDFIIDTTDQEALKNIKELKDNSETILKRIEDSQYKNINIRNQESHEAMISGCDRAIKMYEQNSTEHLIKPFKKSEIK